MVFYNNGMIGRTIRRSDVLYRKTIERKIEVNRDRGDKTTPDHRFKICRSEEIDL